MPVFICVCIGAVFLLDIIIFFFWRLTCGNYGRRSERGHVKRTEFQGDFEPVNLCNCLWSLTCKARLESMFCNPCMLAENITKTSNPEPRPPPLFKTFCHLQGLMFLSPLSCGIYYVYCITQNRMDNARRPHPDMSGTWFCPECVKAVVCWPCSTAQVSEFIEVYEEFYEGRKPEWVWESWKSKGANDQMTMDWTPEQQAQWEWEQQQGGGGGY